MPVTTRFILPALLASAIALLSPVALHAANPVITHVFTADPAALVHDGRVGGIQHDNKLGHGGSFRRSVCIDYLYYNRDGTLKRVIQTTECTDLPPAR